LFYQLLSQGGVAIIFRFITNFEEFAIHTAAPESCKEFF
jgi:hypothetical protein